MTDEELLKLSAYFDGEATEADQRAIEASLPHDPAARGKLAGFAKLCTAVRGETIPQPFVESVHFVQNQNGDEFWGMLSERIQARSNGVETPAEILSSPESLSRNARLIHATVSEMVPVISNERFDGLLRGIWHEKEAEKKSSRQATARQDVAPRIETRRWKSVWNEISNRTSAKSALKDTSLPSHGAKSPSRDERPSQRVRMVLGKGPSISSWILAAGAGLAASILLVFAFPNAATKQPVPAENSATASMMMNIPEVQAEGYGLRVRFVSGSRDPIFSLYFKTTDQADHATVKSNSAKAEKP